MALHIEVDDKRQELLYGITVTEKKGKAGSPKQGWGQRERLGKDVITGPFVETLLTRQVFILNHYRTGVELYSCTFDVSVFYLVTTYDVSR